MAALVAATFAVAAFLLQRRKFAAPLPNMDWAGWDGEWDGELTADRVRALTLGWTTEWRAE